MNGGRQDRITGVAALSVTHRERLEKKQMNMARLELYLPYLAKWEGQKANHPADRGGLTVKGVTLPTLRQLHPEAGKAELETIDEKTWKEIVERLFWQRWQADRISSQSVAEMLVDWTWMSGSRGIVLPQTLLRVKPDGIVGPETLEAVNTSNPEKLFSRLRESRRRFYMRLVQHTPRQRCFLNGWLRRLDDLTFKDEAQAC